MKKTMSPSAKPAYRQLPVELTPTERMARAMTAAERQSEYCELESQKKATTSTLGRQLKEIRSEIEDLQRAVRSGKETQSVQVETLRNEARRTVETLRLDTGEVVDTRPMTVEERQGKLFGIDGGKVDDLLVEKAAAADAKADAKKAADAKGEKKPRARRNKTTTPSAS